MFLQEDKWFDHAQDRFVGQSLVAHELNEVDKRNLDYVIGSSGDTLRLYWNKPDGDDQRGGLEGTPPRQPGHDPASTK